MARDLRPIPPSFPRWEKYPGTGGLGGWVFMLGVLGKWDKFQTKETVLKFFDIYVYRLYLYIYKDCIYLHIYPKTLMKCILH
jgi:hypothetical protein